MELIKDLTFDKISVEQALTRAKIIAFELENDDFKSWINFELNGYPNESIQLPDYRIYPCEVFAIIQTYHGRQTIPFDVSELDKT